MVRLDDVATTAVVDDRKMIGISSDITIATIGMKTATTSSFMAVLLGR